MGRLEVQIRHGHDGGGWGAVAALIVFIAFAAGGAAHKQLAAAAHGVMTAVEVVAVTLAVMVMLAAAAGLTWAGWKIRGAARARRAAPAITLAADRYEAIDGTGRPALDQPRPSWPLAGQWSQTDVHTGDDDDRR